MPTKTQPAAPPTRPEDVDPSSPLGTLYSAYQRRLAQMDDLAAFPRRVQLRKQLAGYQQIIAGACPESDMTEVAAAEIGLAIVKRALKPLDEEIVEWEAITERFRERWDTAWGAYARAVSSLTFYSERADWTALNQAEAAIREALGRPHPAGYVRDQRGLHIGA